MRFYCIFFFFILTVYTNHLSAQQTIWSETFDVPEKGYWGDGSGSSTGDMSGISKWTINVSSCVFADAADYIKTVSTSGGRLQAVDINGEAVWFSELIDISEKPNVTVSVAVSETGSSTVAEKYANLFYRIDGGAEIAFGTNGINTGNYGSVSASQSGINGNNLQIIARISNPNAADACIIDDLVASYDDVKPYILFLNAISSSGIRIVFSEPVQKSFAENTFNYLVVGLGNPTTALLNGDNRTVDLIFPVSFLVLTNYSMSISGIPDLNANFMEIANISFIYKNFELKDIRVSSQNELEVLFTHPLNQASAETISNYSVSNGIGNPSTAVLLNDTLVKLTFSANFVDNLEYRLSVDNLSDAYGIVLNGANSSFIYHKPQAFDIVINELMVDVNPAPNVLPAAKFIELYNRSNYDIDISAWSLQIENNTPVTFPPFVLNSNNYLIICSSNQVNSFSGYGPVLGILSESQLTTTGKQILLQSKQGDLIDYIRYSDSWYNNPDKADGGWSLERIDAGNFCGEVNNWAASADFKGGTPGKINSSQQSNLDVVKPALLSIEILSSNILALNFSKNIIAETALNVNNYTLDEGLNDPLSIIFPDSCRSTIILQFTAQFIDNHEQTLSIKNLRDFCGNQIDVSEGKFTYYMIHPKAIYPESDRLLHVLFSEEVDIVSAQISSNYLVNNGIGSPSKAYKHSGRLNEVYLEFSAELVNSQSYSIHIENVKDINGNPIKPADLSFIYFEPSFNDLVINEVLFNPRPNGVDFVEIYNKSGFPVDLCRMSLASRDESGQIESVKSLVNKNLLLNSGHFLAISGDTIKIKNEYPAIKYDSFLQISSMPSFNDDKGTIVLMSGDSIIDEFTYTQDMHFDLITDPEGISLERIDPDKASQVETNWHSAAETHGFGTPANLNSQFYKLSADMDDDIVIEPETFSPNNDGYDDLVFIRYKFNDPGYVANVSIFDGKGRILKKIASNELLATEGEFSWDGLSEDNTKAGIGIYVIYFEIFNLQGVVKKYKKVCVLAERLR